MKTLIFLFLISFSLLGKTQTFTLNDTSFQVGDSLVAHFNYNYNHGVLTYSTKKKLDSLVTFLIVNSNLSIEISNHEDSRCSEDYGYKLTDLRANSIKKYFTSKGIIGSRLTSKGHGKSIVIYSNEEINSVKTEEEKEKLHAQNRRTVFKITALDFQPKTFELNDTSFQVGDSLILDINYYMGSGGRVTPASHRTVDSLVLFLIKNPSIKFEISTHSDSRGGEDYNLRLTEGRSRQLQSLIIKKGINPERLISKGYGESKLIISDKEINEGETEEIREKMHAQNRRTVFKIIAL